MPNALLLSACTALEHLGCDSNYATCSILPLSVFPLPCWACQTPTELTQLDFGMEPCGGLNGISWVGILINLQGLCLNFGKVQLQVTKQFSLLSSCTSLDTLIRQPEPLLFVHVARRCLPCLQQKIFNVNSLE